MWKALIAAVAVASSHAWAQTPAVTAALAPYVAALQASSAFLPGGGKYFLSLANYDPASHQALAREAYTRSILGGGLSPAERLHAAGGAMPTAARWSTRRYLLLSQSQCEMFINVRDVVASVGRQVEDFQAFSVWHELAHCMLLDLMEASAAGEGGQRSLSRDMTARLGSILPGQGKLAYGLLNEAFADSFALLVQASVRGTPAARDQAATLLQFRRQEQAQHAAMDGAGGHDTSIAIELAQDALNRYDLSPLSPRDRYVLAMNIAVDATTLWAQRQAGAGAAIGALLGELQGRLLPAANAAAAPRAALAPAVYLAWPGQAQPKKLLFDSAGGKE